MEKKYEIIIFDLDGTLLDTSPGIFNSVRFAEQQMGFTPVTQAQLKAFVGPPPKEMYQKFHGVDEETAIKATSFHRQYSREKAIYEAEIYPGMRETLAALKQQGYKLAVATLKGQKIAEEILKIYKIADFFDAIVGMDAAESFTKCKTIHVAMELSGATGTALMVGDSEYDYVGAVEAGVDFVGASYGFGIDKADTRFPLIAEAKALLAFLKNP
ncbi:MAG: HAD hydrolase-like protein [Oscillospiraceae bacterium]|nr:HAD hydrolase-like protein [Oscillospiraceae bacterium]